jgi:hypothetical protein
LIIFSKENKQTTQSRKTENEKLLNEITFTLLTSTPEFSSKKIVSIVENKNVKNLKTAILIFSLFMIKTLRLKP